MRRNKELSGTVVNIQRYCLHDGPGIRTLLFLKGCPLRCPWCSNPEAINPEAEVAQDKSRCIRCGTCVRICPAQCLEFVDGKFQITRDRCDRCKICLEHCAAGALRLLGQTLTVDEVMKKMMQDLPFYRRSGGGVTLSGGEPILQYRFVLALLNALKAKGIHTAIETTGFQKWKIFAKILENVDLVYFDLKIIDEKEHKRILGVSNVLILENARKIMAGQSRKVVFRAPVIPSYTDSEGNIRGIAIFLRKIGYGGKVEIIPYHRFGESKYTLLNKEYPLKGTTLPALNQLERMKEIIEGEGVAAQINL
jgi:pyruvate formate lyase activating enzyme